MTISGGSRVTIGFTVLLDNRDMSSVTDRVMSAMTRLSASKMSLNSLGISDNGKILGAEIEITEAFLYRLIDLIQSNK